MLPFSLVERSGQREENGMLFFLAAAKEQLAEQKLVQFWLSSLLGAFGLALAVSARELDHC